MPAPLWDDTSVNLIRSAAWQLGGLSVYGCSVPPNATALIAMFLIKDEIHCELKDPYLTYGEAVAELRRLAVIPWDQPPNKAPCTSWGTCGREYVIIEIDNSFSPWRELRRVFGLAVSAEGVKWACGFSGSESAVAAEHGAAVNPFICTPEEMVDDDSEDNES